MRRRQQAGLDLRRHLDRATSIDRGLPAEEIYSVAHDAFLEEKKDKALDLVATIPPIKLGKTVYRVVIADRHGLTIVGPRGGTSFLVATTNQPNVYAHNTMNGTQGWYRCESDGSFTKI